MRALSLENPLPPGQLQEPFLGLPASTEKFCRAELTVSPCLKPSELHLPPTDHGTKDKVPPMAPVASPTPHTRGFPSVSEFQTHGLPPVLHIEPLMPQILWLCCSLCLRGSGRAEGSSGSSAGWQSGARTPWKSLGLDWEWPQMPVGAGVESGNGSPESSPTSQTRGPSV